MSEQTERYLDYIIRRLHHNMRRGDRKYTMLYQEPDGTPAYAQRTLLRSISFHAFKNKHALSDFCDAIFTDARLIEEFPTMSQIIDRCRMFGILATGAWQSLEKGCMLHTWYLTMGKYDFQGSNRGTAVLVTIQPGGKAVLS